MEAALAASPTVAAALVVCGGTLVTLGAARLRQPGRIAARIGPARPREAIRPKSDGAGRAARDRLLQPLLIEGSRLVRRVTPRATLDAYRRQLAAAGDDGPDALRTFLGLKGLLAVGLTGLYVLLTAAAGSMPALLPLIALFVAGFYLPNYVLRGRAAGRRARVQRSLPDALDLLTICVEAGLGFDGAIGRVADKRDDDLSREFGRALNDMRMGKARRDALRALAERTDVPDVSTFVSAIVQAEQLGVSIARVLSSQSVQIRQRRRQRAEEQAQKASIKMLFPMVFLIFPSIFVVILGPAIPGILRSFS